jgi:hypothetical protein
VDPYGEASRRPTEHAMSAKHAQYEIFAVSSRALRLRSTKVNKTERNARVTVVNPTMQLCRDSHYPRPKTLRLLLYARMQVSTYTQLNICVSASSRLLGSIHFQALAFLWQV